MGVVVQIVVTAVISAAISVGAVWWLWHKVLLPDTELRVRELADELTANASQQLTESGEALVPKFRRAVRDGIQDAVLAPPTDRIGQTARGVTTAGVNVADAVLRRIFGTSSSSPTPEDEER